LFEVVTSPVVLSQTRKLFVPSVLIWSYSLLTEFQTPASSGLGMKQSCRAVGRTSRGSEGLLTFRAT